MSSVSSGGESPRDHVRVLVGLYPLQNLWRVGRKVGRTIYAQVGPEPSDDDVLIGMMDTEPLARCAVDAHNASLIPGRT